MKFIQSLADGYWVSGQTKGYDLYTGWIDLLVENLSYEKQVWVDFTLVQSLMGRDTTHQVSIPATFKETLPNNKERWGCHTPEFLPVMECPGMLSYTREASYRARMIVEGQEIIDLEKHVLYKYTPQTENPGRFFAGMEFLSPPFGSDEFSNRSVFSDQEGQPRR